jgi:hypothetical protein
LSTEAPQKPEFNFNELFQEDPQNNSGKSYWLVLLLFFLAIVAGGIIAFFAFSNQSQESATSGNFLLGPTDLVESYGWDELGGVCLSNRIIGAAPLKGVCGPTWEKLFTQVENVITTPGETITNIETVFAPGNRVYLARSNPRAQLGIVNDVFINTSNGNLFTKTPTGWNLSSNVAVEREVTVTEIQTVTETRFVQIPGGSLGEGSTSFGACDDEVAISATPVFDATSSTWKLNTIEFSDISNDCNGQTLAIQLFDSSKAELYSSTLQISGTSVTFENIKNIKNNEDYINANDVDQLAFSIYE